MKQEQATRLTINAKEKEVIATALYEFIKAYSDVNLYEGGYSAERNEKIQQAENVLIELGYKQLVEVSRKERKQAQREYNEAILKEQGLL